MSLPSNVVIIGRIDGGRRNHINLASMFGENCASININFQVIESGGKQAIYRIDSDPEPFEKVIASFADCRYLIDQQRDQFIPVILPQGGMELFDCRSGGAVLKDYDGITIVKSFTKKDTTYREECNEWRPALLRAALCRVEKDDKFGLIIVVSADSPSYGFGVSEFGSKVSQTVKMDVVYDSIDFDEANHKIVTVKNGKTITMPID